MDKMTAWILLMLISAFEVIILYFGFDGDIQKILLPIVAYLFGIVSKTGVDKIINGIQKN